MLDEVHPTQPQKAARLGRSAGPGERSHGYRVRVDRSRHTLELQSAGAMTMDPSCSPTALICDDGTTPECDASQNSCGWIALLEISGETAVSGTSLESGYDLSGGEYGPYYCPAYVDDPHFVWKGKHFQIEGRVVKIEDLPAISGIPKARYRLPPGPWMSDDGTAKIWSGTIDGTCFVRDHHILGLRVTEGYMGWYRFAGDFDDGSSPRSGGGSGTWVSYGDGGGYLDRDAARALLAFLDDGTCTDGWVIVVDGVRVC